MTPPTAPPVHPAVAAILAVTPIDPEGLVITGFQAIRALDDGQLPMFGDPAPVAARQAAAVLRWLADDLDAKADAINSNPRYRPRIHVDPSGLRQLADEISPEETDDLPPADATEDLNPDDLENGND